MFSKDDLDTTAGKVNISGQKKKADEYKKSMEDTFNGFISSTKQLPLEKQLKFIEEHLGKQLPLDKKEHFLFFLAAIATARNASLPDNHQEQTPINKLLGHLNEGFTNGFTRVGIPKVDLMKKIIRSFYNWLEAYEPHDPEMSHNVLLAFYCITCFFESQLSQFSAFLPDNALDGIKKMKEKIGEKFTQLVQTHGDSLKNSVASSYSALQQLAPEKLAYEQFKVNLSSIKEREAKIERLMQLHWTLLSIADLGIDDPMVGFWKEYNTQEEFNQLMDDLALEPSQREQWQSYFNAEHGEGMTKIWDGFMTSVGTATFSQNILSKNAYKALAKLNIDVEKYEPPIPLIQEIESEFNALKDVEKKDIQALKAHQSQIKSAQGIKADTLNVVVGEINEFQRHLDAQKQYVLHLQIIYNKILKLNELGIKTDDLLGPFGIMLDHAVKTVPHGNKQIDQKLPEEKIDALLKGIEETGKEAAELGEKINEDVAKIRILIDSDSKDAILDSTRSFIEKHKNNFLHKILCFFSKTYKEMFESLNEAVKENDTTRVVSILVGKAEEYAETHTVAMLFNETQELQTLKTPAKS